MTGRAPVGIATAGLDHIALRTTDLDRSRRFYVEVLGLPLVTKSERLFIVRAGSSLVGCIAPDGATAPDDVFDPRRVGLDHIALACDDEAELVRVAEALRAAGVENTGVHVSPTRANRYLAFKDPDGIAWQLAMR